MLPNGFKKDSRVWLHKNSQTSVQRPPYGGPDDTGTKRCHVDDCYCESPMEEAYPLITDATGRVFKKDSRTWLHKSSVKHINSPTDIALVAAAKKIREDFQQIHGGREDPFREPQSNLVHTRSSLEIAASRRLQGLDADCKENLRRAQPGQKLRLRQTCVSYHEMRVGAQEHHQVNSFVSDYCIHDKPQVFATYSSGSDSDSDRDRDLNLPGRQRPALLPPNHPKELGMCRVCRSCCDSTVQITQDGLQQLEWMMQQQARQRSVQRRSVGPMMTDDDKDTLDRDISPATLSSDNSDSKLSLHATVSLSQECINENSCR